MPPKYPCKRIDLLFGITMTIRAERIEATSTKKGLTVTVRLNLKQYQKGITVDARISVLTGKYWTHEFPYFREWRFY